MKRAALFFAVLTVVMTWPLALHLDTLASPHQDVYFNMWRLRWFAHALQTSPLHLFDANIFYPERSTLALSDAMFVEGLVAAPLVWARLPPVLVHNIMMLLPIAASGVAMFALARYLTGSAVAALIAGVAFAYAPYRYEHFMHMELQWTVWMPLAFLALHRTFDTGRLKYGLATGLFVALQMLSCIYYGIFLATLIGFAAVLLAVGNGAVPLKKIAVPLVAGGLLAAALSAAYAVPYMRQHARVGDRSTGDIISFSATPVSYLSVPAGNWMYGTPLRPGRAERRLFPGAIITLLAIVGVLLRPPTRRVLLYVLILVAAFEMSLGFSGYSYPVLFRYVAAYRGLRAMARLGIFVVMALSVLGAYGYAAMMAGQRAAIRYAAGALLLAGLLLEYRTTVALMEFPNTAPPIYRLLAHQPRGVVAELPFPLVTSLPGGDPLYAYFSTFHWFPLTNGYSGNFPASYLRRVDRMQEFPDDRSVRSFRVEGVRYVLVHGAQYTPQKMERIRLRLIAEGMVELGAFDASDGRAYLFGFP